MTSSNTPSSPLNAIADQALGLADAPAQAAAVAAAPEAVAAEAAAPAGPTFASLGLSADVVSALTAAGYQNPTPVQQRAIPAAYRRPRPAGLEPDRFGQDRRVHAARHRAFLATAKGASQPAA